MKRLLVAALGALICSAAFATVPTNLFLKVSPTPSGIVDPRYPDGNDGTAGVIEWGTIANVSVATGATGSLNLRTLYLTGTGAASATLSTSCLPTLGGGFSTTADGLAWSSATAGAYLCRTTATYLALTSRSRPYLVSAIAPPAADTTAPTVPTGLACTNATAAFNCSIDASSDVFEADGDAASGVTAYDVKLGSSVVSTLTGQSPGLNPQLTQTIIGSYTPTPTSTQNGADWDLTSAGDIDGTDDLVVVRGAQVTGNATIIVKVNSIDNTQNFAKAGVWFRGSHATNSAYFACYPYRSSAGVVKMQTRRRTVDGGNAASPSADVTVTLPLYIRATRSGDASDLFGCDYSTDGNNWTVKDSSSQMTLPSSAYAEMFTVATTASGGATATGHFQQFSVNNVGRVSFTVNGITAGNVSVRARDVTGNNSAYSSTVAVAPVIPVDSTPPTFTVQPSGTSGGQTSINWSAGTATDASGIRGYIPSFCGTSSSCSGGVDQAEQASNSITQTGLTASTTYYFRSKAVDTAGNVSAYSNIVSQTTDAGAAPAFTAPTVTSVTAVNSSTLRITHTAITGADHYILRAADNVAGPYTILTQFDHTALTVDRTGLASGQKGCYEVAAANADESVTGPWSAASESTTCATTTTVAGAIKWHPGQYVWITQSTLSSANLTTIQGQITDTCSNSNIKGYQIIVTWASLEGTTLGDYSAGFSAIDTLVNKVTSCNKRLMVGIKVAAYGGARNYTPSSCSDANFTWVIPRYVLCDSQYGNASAPYGVAYSGSGVAWSGGLVTVGMIWTQSVMDRLIALSAAYSAHVVTGTSYTLDTHPNFEMLGADETAISVPSGSFSYSHSALVAQLKRRLAADATAWPHTQIRLPANFTGSDSMMIELFNACIATKNCSVGGPDPELSLPLTTEVVKVGGVNTTVIAATGTRRTIQANELWRGNVSVTDDSGNARWKVGGGTDFRGQTHWISEVQNLGLNDRVLTTPVSGLQDEATNAMRAAYMIWLRGGRWTEVLAQINADSTLYTTTCPTNFVSCNTN
jgi:hypothetical protein